MSDYKRLSDKILEALNLALDQEDFSISEQLMNALELSLTRNAGGAEFTERRDFSDEMDNAMTRFDALRAKNG